MQNNQCWQFLGFCAFLVPCSNKMLGPAGRLNPSPVWVTFSHVTSTAGILKRDETIQGSVILCHS